LIWIIIALVLMAVLLPVAQNIFGGLLPQPR